MANATETSKSKVIAGSDAQFAALLKEHPVLVVDCYADWCAPCKMIAPVIDAFSEEYAGKVTFVKLDVDNNPQTASGYSVRAIPTLLFFKGGKMVDQQVGALPKHALKQRIDALLND